jgi:hypothetical protein
MSRIALAMILVACLGGAAEAQPVWTRVTYISGPNVYIEAGTTLGVREGTHLDVVRDDVVVAELVAQYVSSSRASCTIARAERDPVVGDSVRFSPPSGGATVVAPDSVAAVDSAAAASPVRARRAAFSAGRIRGRIGVRYLTLDQGAGAPGTFAQPGLDLRLDGDQIGGGPLGIAVDVRTQRSLFAGMTGDSTPRPMITLSRVYQAVLKWNAPGSRTHVSLGRQFPAALSTIGIFDGLAIDVDRDRWSVGALGGTDPDPLSMGLSQTTRRYGAYAQLHNTPAHVPLWTLTLGGVGAYDRGQIDREFAYLRATFTSPRFSLFAAQELDVNRGWKATLERASTTPTSTFAIAQVTIADWLTLNGGADNRRNVRLYRDYQNPESVFDDTFRQGVWGGASLSLFRHLRLSSDVRRSSGGTAGDGQSVTSAASLVRVSPLLFALHARHTAYTGTGNKGTLQSASVEVNPFGIVRLEWTMGRRESMLTGDVAPSRLVWTGLDADVSIGRALYVMLSASRETGAGERTLQTFATLSYRF